MLRSTPILKGGSITTDACILEDSIPVFVLIKGKMIRCKFWNRWKTLYQQRKETGMNMLQESFGECLSQFIENSQTVFQKRHMFNKWQASASISSDCTTQINDSDLSISDLSFSLASQPSSINNSKYLEFASELQSTVRSIAKYETTIEVLDSKISELTELYRTTKAKADSMKNAAHQASDKYEELLQMVSQRKIEHRDQVAELQLKIGERRRLNRAGEFNTITDPEIVERLVRDKAVFDKKMQSINERFEEIRAKATHLRIQLGAVEDKNRQLETEISKMTKEKNELGDIEESVIVSNQNTEATQLMNLLKLADKQLKESSNIIRNQSMEIRELDYQIIKRRRILCK